MRRRTDEIAFVLAIIVIRDDDDVPLCQCFDGFDDGLMSGHGDGPGRGSAEQVVWRDGTVGRSQDGLGGLARDPGVGLVADLRNGAGRKADRSRKIAAPDAILREPLSELHALTLEH